uniref:Saccharopine dehydrogenase family protein n=1 Tax=candidate division WOR-3 bacterium TaxID=2052148 RepID=A0A7C6A962_UNCW3
MNIGVLGCGRQGSVIAQDLAKAGHWVNVFDSNPENLEQLKNLPNIKTNQFDVTDRQALIKLLKKFDIVVGALPSRLGFYAMNCAIEAGVDMVDISYLAEDPFQLQSIAKRRRIKIVPDAGFAPGLSNILIGEAYQELKPIERIRILAGGIPQNPIPPFNYRITWSLTDLIEEYLRPVRLRRNSRIVKVAALSGVEIINLKGIGKLECFYTDGLRTLLRTCPEGKNMEEKTIRYIGHSNLFKILIDCGFFSDQPIEVAQVKIKPKEFTLAVLKPQLSQGDTRAKRSEKDITILMVEVLGKSGRRKYTCIEHYDEKNKITAMARMTGYTCSIITQCIKDYLNYGIIPPEYLGMDKKLNSFIKQGLKARGIEIKISNGIKNKQH